MHMDNRGFTLIELILSMVITLIFTGLVFTYFMFNTTLYTKANNEANIQRECAEILEVVTVMVKESAAIEERVPGEEYTFYASISDYQDYIDNPSVDTHQGFVTYYPETQQLSIVDMDGVSYPINKLAYSNISSFYITPEPLVPSGNRIMEITITGKRDKETLNFSAAASMRN